MREFWKINKKFNSMYFAKCTYTSTPFTEMMNYINVELFKYL